jgi:hypothetical protein
VSLSSRWIDALFARLLVRYGASWLRMWDGVEIEAVKADWSRMLAGFKESAIRHALDHLPDSKPPTAGEFRALCARTPEYAPPALPAPRTDIERVRRVLALAKDAVSTQGVDRLTRAQALLARAERGEIRLTQAQKDWARDVLARTPRGEDDC